MNILVAEDDAVTRRLLEAQLTKWGYEVTVCSDGLAAEASLQADTGPQLAILDWMMPGISGLSLCRKIRAWKHERYIYTVLLTARNQREDILEGLEAGADDYLTKPFDPNELRVRVRAGARIVELQRNLMEALKISDFRATHDALTSLWNRASILDVLGNELNRSARDGVAVAVIMADVDHFKHVNDRYGHLAGDAVLRKVADRIKSLVRPYDSSGRYGGEEFLIVLPGCSIEDAEETAERIRSSFSDNPIITSEGLFNVTMSFGVAAEDGGAETESDAMVRAADQALYEAKNSGRNRVVRAKGAESWKQHERSKPVRSLPTYDQGWEMLI